MQYVRRLASPYNVNGAALACLPEALADSGYITEYVAQVHSGREQLQREYTRYAIPHWTSAGNFVLASFGALKNEFMRAMRSRGVLVRDRSHDYACEGCVRITIGTAEQTARLLAAFRETMAELRVQEALN